MKDKSKRLTVINTSVTKKSDSPGSDSTNRKSSISPIGLNPIGNFLLKSTWNEAWEIKSNEKGHKYIYGKLPLVLQYGLTMYAGNDGVNIPSIYDGLPIDSQTIYWEDIKDDNGVVVGKILKAKIGGGTLGSLTNVGEWADSVASVDRIMIQKQGSDKWVAMDASKFGTSASFENISESGEGNAYTSFLLSEDKKSLSLVKGQTFITASDSEDITGIKNFINGLQINGVELKYDSTNNAVFIQKSDGSPVNFYSTGGISMYGQGNTSVKTIMDAITANLDTNTLAIENGLLTVVGGTGGIESITKQMVIDALGFTPYDASNPNGYITSTALSGYLPITGGTITSSNEIPFIINSTSSTTRSYMKFAHNSATKALIGYTVGDGAFIRNSLTGHTLNIVNDGLYFNGNKVWHEGNDGAGSGLDADTLDGKHNGELTANDAKLIKVIDNRAVNELPYGSDKRSLTWHFKERTAIGLATNGYCGLLTLCPWDNNSGGAEHQVAFHQDGTVSRRYGLNEWNQWITMIDSNNISSYALPITGGTITSSNEMPFIINSTSSTTRSYMKFAHNSATKALIGYTVGDGAFIRNSLTGHTLNIVNDGLYFNGNKVWHEGNDGAGSGLDADLWNGFAYEYKVNDYYNNKPYFRMFSVVVKGTYTGGCTSFTLKGKSGDVVDVSFDILGSGVIADHSLRFLYTNKKTRYSEKIRVYKIVNKRGEDGNVLEVRFEVWISGRVESYDFIRYWNVRNTPGTGIEFYNTENSYLPTEYIQYVDANMSPINGPVDIIGSANISGDLRLKGEGNYGNTLYFGDGSYCYIKESSDDLLNLYASQGIVLNGGYYNGVSFVGNENNDILTEYYENGSITNVGIGAQNTSIRHSISFKWYDSKWIIGNIRSGGSGSLGFGVAENGTTLKFRVSDMVYSYCGLNVVGNILSTGGITMYSARILKNIVDERGLSLNELSAIKPTRYKWKDGRDNNIHIGGIADDIQQVLPEVVYKTAEGILTMDYGNAGFVIAASLIKPVVDHEQRIKALERENELLKQELNRLRA